MSEKQDIPLGQICVQVHPGRAAHLDLDQLTSACEAIARSTEGVRGFSATKGEEEGAYLNLVFAAEQPVSAWSLLRPKLLESSELGESLKAACMAMCTGSDGWNDYLLLHHFDPEVPLDDLDEA